MPTAALPSPSLRSDPTEAGTPYADPAKEFSDKVSIRHPTLQERIRAEERRRCGRLKDAWGMMINDGFTIDLKADVLDGDHVHCPHHRSFPACPQVGQLAS